MIRRAREGVRCTSYRPMDYEKLQSEIAERKMAGQGALQKLKHIKAASRQQKEDNLVKQHSIVWQHELARLAALRQQLESELGMTLLNLVDSDDNQLKQIFQDFHHLESTLADDFFKFKGNTTDAIWTLRLSCIIFLSGIPTITKSVVNRFVSRRICNLHCTHVVRCWLQHQELYVSELKYPHETERTYIIHFSVR